MKKIFSLFVISLFVLAAYAQDVSNVYLMKNNPNNLYANPANPIHTKFYIGIPVLSNFNVSVLNAFDYNDLVYKDDIGNYVFSPKRLSESLDDENNTLALSLNFDILNLGMRINKTFLSLGLRHRTDVGVFYPKELVEFFVNGNAAYIDEPLMIEGVDVSLNSYMELSIGVQEVINERLIVGIRPKLLVGMANIGTNTFSASITTAPDYSSIALQEQLHLRTSCLYDVFGDGSIAPAFSNIGFAFDFGATYKINNKFSVGLSVLDLGMIKWKSNNNDLTSVGEYTFEGVEIDGFSEINFDNIIDSLSNAFTFDTIAGEAFTARTYTKILAQGNFDLTEGHRFTASMRLDCIEGRVFPLYSLAYIGNFLNWFEVVGNVYYYRNQVKVGAAVGFNIAKTLKIFVSADNVPGLIKIRNTKSVGANFGIILDF